MKFSAAISALVVASLAGVEASFERIAGYEPKSQVTDHNAIDLDQEAMEIQLATATDASFENAKNIYTKGAFSKSVATVTLATPLTSNVAKGTTVSGVNADGADVVGKTLKEYSSGANILEVQYQTLDVQANYVGCQVGANPNPNTEGCFAASGTLTIEGEGSVSYTYNPLTNNGNGRTIQGFSTGAEEKMFRCENCPYATYQKFYDYYGSFDYADKWVMAAFSGSRTSFSNGNANFALYDFTGKTEAIKKGTAYMNIWMYVIREMEDALDDCVEGCDFEQNCNDDPVHAWDEAVAFYTGSLEGKDGSGDGKLLHALADKRCANFRTCGDLANEDSGASHVNLEIFREFSIGLNKLVQGECASARAQKERIEQLMAVPMIQGTLRYAYLTHHEDSTEKAEAEGAVFAASVLPLVHACNAEAAATIYNNMKVGQNGSANFQLVKDAFESVYSCMGIRSEYVGGLWDSASQQYMKGAAPAGTSSGSDRNIGLIVGLTVGGFVFLVLVYILSVKRGKKAAAQKQLDVESQEQAKSQDPHTSVHDSEVM